MREKKYYVKLKSPNNHKGIWWCGDRSEWQSYSDDPVYGEELDDWGEREVIGWKVSEFIPSFTKSELAEIMGGALYKQTDSLPFEWLYSFESLKEKLGWEFNETIDKWEYSNPIIELVPVEDGE